MVHYKRIEFLLGTIVVMLGVLFIDRGVEPWEVLERGAIVLVAVSFMLHDMPKVEKFEQFDNRFEE